MWKLLNFEALSEEEAMVEQFPELEEMPLSVKDENVQEIKDSDSSQLPPWVFLVVMVIGMIGRMGTIGFIIWKVFNMKKTFKEVKGVLVDKPNLTGLMEVGKMMHRAFSSKIPPITMSS